MDRRRAELKGQLADTEKSPPLLHPNMAEIYHRRFAALYDCLHIEDENAKAAEVVRTRVDQVMLVPDNGELAIILRFVAGKKNPDILSESRGYGEATFISISGCGERKPPRVGNAAHCLLKLRFSH